MLQYPTRRTHNYIHLRQCVSLLAQTFASNDQARREEMAFPTHLAQNLEDLDRELACRRDDHGAYASIWPDTLSAVQILQHGYEKGQRLPTARLRCAQDIMAKKRARDCFGLDVGQSRERGSFETCCRGC